MISDVICDTLSEIDRYTTDPVFKEFYQEAEVIIQLNKLKECLRETLILLNTPK